MPVEEWDRNFLKVDQEMLYEIILAANYLNIKPLLESGCKMVAEMIKSKSPEELRRTFNIINDFSPEEEAAIRKEMNGLKIDKLRRKTCTDTVDFKIFFMSIKQK